MEFWIENVEKFKIYLNIFKCFVLKVCVPCNEFLKVGKFCLIYVSTVYMYGHFLYMYGEAFILGMSFPIICDDN